MKYENEYNTNPNSPEMHNKGGDEYKMMGFCSKEDYERYKRRATSRHKTDKSQ